MIVAQYFHRLPFSDAQNRLRNVTRNPDAHFLGANFSEVLPENEALSFLQAHCDVLLAGCNALLLNQVLNNLKNKYYCFSLSEFYLLMSAAKKVFLRKAI